MIHFSSLETITKLLILLIKVRFLTFLARILLASNRPSTLAQKVAQANQVLCVGCTGDPAICQGELMR
jgi:hypothetical protein